MIDPRLQTLRVLRELGTVTATGYALRLTPSTVSQQMKQLAKEVGAPLLAADGRRVRLTPAADILLEHADVLAAQWERARADLAAHAGGEAGRLRICGLTSVLAALITPAVARLRRDHPAVDVRMSPAESRECFGLLLSGEADVAVLIPTDTTPSATDRRFDQRPLMSDEQDLLVPRGHQFDGRAHVRLADTSTEDWIGMRTDLNQHHVMMTAAAAAGFTPSIAHQAGDWLSAAAMVAHGLGVALMPRMVELPASYPVTRVELRGAPIPTRRILTAVRRGSGGQPLVRLGLDALSATARTA